MYQHVYIHTRNRHSDTSKYLR